MSTSVDRTKITKDPDLLIYKKRDQNAKTKTDRNAKQLYAKTHKKTIDK